MSTQNRNVPGLVTFTNRFVSGLARLGLPLGPNMLLTVRGRKSGTPHSTPVAVIEVAGKRWVQSPFGEVQWTRNLRAAGEGTLTKGRRTERVTATSLSKDEAAAFYRDVLGPNLRHSPVSRVIGRALGLTKLVADPEGAAATHAVFELHHAQ
ncbi:MAG: nitroreductase family deazaflavin-dependent oxidoreductase [Candidatus Dormibacteraeota bacterium]|nr:nitroreductase family deazaflavin-dependent oxidoreductase [Candidatus Dormibacteraeota bacterium]